MFLSERIEATEIERGRYRASCYGAPIAYRRDGSLRRITNALGNSGDPSLTIGVDELVQFRVRSRLSGNAPVVHFGRGNSMVRWTPLGTANVDGLVDGNSILFPEAWPNADLRLAMAGHRLQKDIVLRTGHPASFAFRIDDHVGLDLATLSTPDFRILPPVLIRQGQLDIPLSWVVSVQGGKAFLSVTLPIGDYSGWTLDPTISPTSDSTDGYVNGLDVDYATARNTAVAHAVTSTIMLVGQDTSYRVYRSFCKFDTSSLPDDATIDQVNLKLVCTQDNSATDSDIQICKQDWSAQDPIASGNREAAYDNCLAATLDQVWRNTNGMSLNTQYTSPNLDATRVSKTGYTYYSLRSSLDSAGTTPTTDETIRLATVEHATPGYRPVLDVIYNSAGGSGAHRNRLLLGVG